MAFAFSSMQRGCIGTTAAMTARLFRSEILCFWMETGPLIPPTDLGIANGSRNSQPASNWSDCARFRVLSRAAELVFIKFCFIPFEWAGECLYFSIFSSLILKWIKCHVLVSASNIVLFFICLECPGVSSAAHFENIEHRLLPEREQVGIVLRAANHFAADCDDYENWIFKSIRQRIPHLPFVICFHQLLIRPFHNTIPAAHHLAPSTIRLHFINQTMVNETSPNQTKW